MPMDFKKMNIMLNDLKVMRNELLPDSKESQRDAELKDMDPFTRTKTQLNDILRPLAKEIERLQELRANAPDGRDKNTIRLYTENASKLKEAGELWTKLKEIIQKDEKNSRKPVDEKTISDRKKMMTILAKEIQDLSNKNAHVRAPVKESKTLETLRGRQEEKGRKRREERNRRERKKKKEEEEQDEADAAAGIKKKKKNKDEGPDVDIQEEDFKPMQAASPEEQKFFEQVEEAKAEQDTMLDEIMKGMIELKDIATTMQIEIKTTTELANQVGEEMDKTIANFKSSNQRLKEILEESGGLTRWCPMLICVILLIALVGYLFNMLKS